MAVGAGVSLSLSVSACALGSASKSAREDLDGAGLGAIELTHSLDLREGDVVAIFQPVSGQVGFGRTLKLDSGLDLRPGRRRVQTEPGVLTQ